QLVLRVERRERLVHQQNFRIVGKGARDRHALAHAAGKLVRIILGETGETGAREIVADHLLDGGGWRAPHLEAVGGVVPDRHPGEDRVALEDHRIHRAVRMWRFDLDGAGGDGLEAGKDAQQRGLAASARADNHKELAGGDVERDAVDRDELPERLAQIPDADGRPQRQRFGGFEPGERAGHGWSLELQFAERSPHSQPLISRRLAAAIDLCYSNVASGSASRQPSPLPLCKSKSRFLSASGGSTGSASRPVPKFCRNGRNCRQSGNEVLTAGGRISVDVPPVSAIASTDIPLVTKERAMTKKHTGRCACGAVKFEF